VISTDHNKTLIFLLPYDPLEIEMNTKTVILFMNRVDFSKATVKSLFISLLRVAQWQEGTKKLLVHKAFSFFLTDLFPC
jgi:hypothetical protein